MTEWIKATNLLKEKGKIRGNPVGISLFAESIPDAYRPIQDTPCSIVRYAMDWGDKVYFDASHHDCLVGVHHAGIVPGGPQIVSGEYLSRPSSIFTYEGAARLKSKTPVLPTGMVRAIGAAPLDQVPTGVEVNWVVVVCKPHHANFIAGCRLVREGIPPYGSFGPSLCGEIFAQPWHERNLMVVGGDFGGRMHNRIKNDQLFVVIPSEFVPYLSTTLENAKFKVKESREMTKPSHSDFWKKLATKDQKQPEPLEQTSTAAQLDLAHPWNAEAKALLSKVPEEILEMVIGNAEDYAKSKGYAQVTPETMDEQMREKLGLSLAEMLNSV